MTLASCVQDLNKLVQLLCSDSTAVLENAALAVCDLTKANTANVVSFSVLGAIPLLVHLLRSESAAVQLNAAMAVCSFALENSANWVRFAELGAIQSLMHLLRSKSAAVQANAATAVCYLTLDLPYHPTSEVPIKVSFACFGLERMTVCEQTFSHHSDQLAALFICTPNEDL